MYGRKTVIFFSFMILLSVMISGCNTTSVYRLTSVEYEEKHEEAPIELFVGVLQRPYTPIAVVQSRHYSEQTEQAKAKMVAEIKKSARKIGADAVMDLHLLPKRFEGMVMDERIPFPAWKPGDYYGYFLRGTAVVYEDEQPLELESDVETD